MPADRPASGGKCNVQVFQRNDAAPSATTRMPFGNQTSICMTVDRPANSFWLSDSYVCRINTAQHVVDALQTRGNPSKFTRRDYKGGIPGRNFFNKNFAKPKLEEDFL